MSKDSLIDNLLGIPPIQIGRNPLLAFAYASSSHSLIAKKATVLCGADMMQSVSPMAPQIVREDSSHERCIRRRRR